MNCQVVDVGVGETAIQKKAGNVGALWLVWSVKLRRAVVQPDFELLLGRLLGEMRWSLPGGYVSCEADGADGVAEVEWRLAKSVLGEAADSIHDPGLPLSLRDELLPGSSRSRT